MGMRNKITQKPMFGTVNKPKPTTPTPQEPAVTSPPAPQKPSFKDKFRLSPEQMQEIIKRGKIDSTRPVPNNRPLPGGDKVMAPPPSFKDKFKNSVSQPDLIEETIKTQLGDKYADYQKARQELGNQMQSKDLIRDPITGKMSSSTAISNREQLFKQFGIDSNILPKPVPNNRPLPGGGTLSSTPSNSIEQQLLSQTAAARSQLQGGGELEKQRIISPASQFQQDQQRLYQTQPASQQMQAPQAEPIQPAAQEMQSEQQAPAQDNSAIDAQIAQLQQQIAQLQSQKK